MGLIGAGFFGVQAQISGSILSGIDLSDLDLDLDAPTFNVQSDQ